MEIQHSDYTSWAFTLRKTSIKKAAPTKENYNLYLKALCQKTNTILKEHVFEETGGLHMHGVLQIHYATNMKLFRTRGWKIHLENIWNYDGWRHYFMKEQIIQDHAEDIDQDIDLDIDSSSRIEDDVMIYRLRKSLFQNI